MFKKDFPQSNPSFLKRLTDRNTCATSEFEFKIYLTMIGFFRDKSKFLHITFTKPSAQLELLFYAILKIPSLLFLGSVLHISIIYRLVLIYPQNYLFTLQILNQTTYKCQFSEWLRPCVFFVWIGFTHPKWHSLWKCQIK